MPPILTGLSLLIFFRQAHIERSLLTVVIGHTLFVLALVYRIILARLQALSPSMIEASLDLGASRLQTFRRIVLPMTLPGIVGGSIIVFIPSLGNFVVPSILGGAKVMMIGNLIEQQFLSARNWPFGSALGMVAMAAVLALLLVYVRLLSRGDARGATPPARQEG
jgi:spermidine/putrescine transport system permease protein